MDVVVCVPARMESTRLPGKVLLADTGKTVLQHTCEATGTCPVVVTPDARIVAEVNRGHWAKPLLRPDDGRHRSGTSRIAECLSSPWLEDAELIVNVQADEPTLPHGAVQCLIAVMQADPEALVGTMTCLLGPGDLHDPNVVKVAVSAWGYALYFSRAPLAGSLKHVGVYAYRRNVLEVIRYRFHRGETPDGVEKAENLEQLFFVEAGMKILTIHLPEPTISIDTSKDYEEFRRWHAAKEGTKNAKLYLPPSLQDSP